MELNGIDMQRNESDIGRNGKEMDRPARILATFLLQRSFFSPGPLTPRARNGKDMERKSGDIDAGNCEISAFPGPDDLGHV